MNDLEWLKTLEADKTYSGIDVQREYGKMCQWCKVNRKQPTYRRFVNWLNKVDKPLNGATISGVYGKRYLPPVHEVPENERETFLQNARTEIAKLKTQLNR